MEKLHPQWRRLVAAIRAARRGPVLVLGAVNTGKTTLVRQLASALVREGPVWIIAADMGQAWLGPPTTLGRVRIARPVQRWLALRPERLIFVGATSPAVCLRQSAAALVRLALDGVRAGERVLVDTPGLVTGRLAEALWGRVATRLRPPLVIAVEEGRELAPILGPFRDAGARVLKVRPDPRVRVRNRTERTAYRAAAYRRYFRRARVRLLNRERIAVVPAVAGRAAVLDAGRLAALRDAAGRDLALALLRSVGPKRIALTTPLGDLAAIATLAVGLLRVDAHTGEETIE